MYDVGMMVLEIIIVVVFFTVLYRMLPFKHFNSVKPKFVLFPKYKAKYEVTKQVVESNIEQMGFVQKEDGIYHRGKVYGDFSANKIKLAIEIDEMESELKIYASFFGVLFDNGDLWEITEQAIKVK